MTISIICAMSLNGVIGDGNRLPWHIPEDLQRFKAITLNHRIIMGKNTYLSLNKKPLPERENVVISSTLVSVADGFVLCRSIEEALELPPHANDEIFCIGGGQLFEAMLPLATKLYLTELQYYVKGDCHFNKLDTRVWNPVSIRKGANSKEGEGYFFTNWERSK